MSDAVRDDAAFIAHLKEENVGLKHRNEKLSRERDEFEAALSTLTEKHDSLEKQVTTPDSKDARIKELEGTIRLGKHREAFGKLAKAAGVKDEAVADLFDLIRSKPGEFGTVAAMFEADEPDGTKYEGVIAKAKESRGYAFAPAQEATEEPDGPTWPEDRPFKPTRTPDPVGTSRGQRNDGSGGALLRFEQLADPAFALNPANAEMLTAAAKEHRFR